MIYVKTLRALLAQLPEDAMVHAYEGEDHGISIRGRGDDSWWIRAREGDQEDALTEGFPPPESKSADEFELIEGPAK